VNLKEIKIKTDYGTNKDQINITSIRHPLYHATIDLWEKYRLSYDGGQAFIDEYTDTFSVRETPTEFIARKKSTYCPAHAKVAVNEIKDAISERLIDVERIDGPVSYQNAIIGLNDGVDRAGSTMNGFVSSEILPEVLSMGKVGVFVDRFTLPDAPSKADVASVPPYIYTYKAEDILAWDYSDDQILLSLLLRDEIYVRDGNTNLPNGTEFRYRHLELMDDGIQLTLYNNAGEMGESMVLNLDIIPFTIIEIQQSLMTDIANYQIALLNLGSSDLSYAIKSNFPFYTEQFDPKDIMTHMLSGNDSDDGTSDNANKASDPEIKVGVSKGRKYPKGSDRPGFIHPSAEPMMVSMDKQKALQNEIRELIRLNVKSLASGTEEGKEQDSRSVESGLSSIGADLEKGERKIGDIWAGYTDEDSPTIIYPQDYSLSTDEERRKEAKELEEHITQTQSMTLKKVLTKQVAHILAGHKVTKETMEKIEKEIDTVEVIITDPEVIRADLEASLVSTELASSLRGYPEGQVKQAKLDHAERIKRIALSQSAASIDGLNSSRGVDDADANNNTAADEKTLSRETDFDAIVTDKTRGEGE